MAPSFVVTLATWGAHPWIIAEPERLGVMFMPACDLLEIGMDWALCVWSAENAASSVSSSGWSAPNATLQEYTIATRSIEFLCECCNGRGGNRTY